jgi:putative peptidoglycan lipid II flippase
VSFGSVKLLGSAYYALQDYRTPLRASMASLVASAVAAVAIAWPLRASPLAAAGIALGSALGSYVNFAILLRGLRERLGTLYTPAMWTGTVRILVATLWAVAAGSAMRLAIAQWLPGAPPRLTALPMLAAFGTTYLLVAWWKGSAEAARWLRRPARGTPHG